MTDFDDQRTLAEKLDAADPLAGFRGQFVIDDPSLIYMDGNSLGRLPTRTKNVLANVVDRQWGNRLIQSWQDAWFDAPQRVGAKIAALVGASPDEVIVSDSTSINLFKTAMAALAMKPERNKIVTDEFNFPSDIYILQGCCDLLKDGHQIELIRSKDSIEMDTESISLYLDDNTALLTLSQVVFKSGYLYDVRRITEMAHAKGALVLWDLSHSVGSVPIHLNDWGVDFAIGCTYKYLNGGPGAPAFLYVRRDLLDRVQSPIWGWFGDANPFSFSLDYTPSDQINRFLVGTPGVLSLLAMEPGVDLILEAGIDRLREKSVQQTSYLIDLFDTFLAPLGFTLGTPKQPEHRGSHVSIRHPEGYRTARVMIEEQTVIPDFR
jgi:kynureninase